jgi:hypothetical protein
MVEVVGEKIIVVNLRNVLETERTFTPSPDPFPVNEEGEKNGF